MKATFLLLTLTTAAFSQGSLTPPGSPAPTQKSLQEIWDKIGVVEAQSAQLQAQNLLLKSQLITASFMDAISPAGLALPWNFRSVDSGGSYTSLAFGPDGQPAISYYDASNGDLRIARFNGSVWTATIVASAGNVGSYSSLAFGPDGQPAISYYDSSNGDLKIARFNGSVWTATTTDSAGNVGLFTSLAFGPDGQPAISYAGNGGVHMLKITRFNGTVWTATVVDNNGLYGSATSLAFGPDGQPAIAYADTFDDILEPPHDELWIARFNGSVWTISIVDATVYLGFDLSLAFGPDGQPAVSYYDKGNQDLRISRFNGTAWSPTTVDSVGFTGASSSLAFGPDGQPAISYQSDGQIKIARFNGVGWSASTVDGSGYFNHTSLAFGPDGQPAISYAGEGLMFARKGVFPPAP